MTFQDAILFGMKASIMLSVLAIGLEVLVLDGHFTESAEDFTAQSWLRLPVGATLRAKAGAQGCKVWVKTGHLAQASAALTVAAMGATPPA